MLAGKDQSPQAIKLDLIDKMITTIAAELGQLKNKPARRAEIIAQVNQLRDLYQSLKSGDDSSLKDQ